MERMSGEEVVDVPLVIFHEMKFCHGSFFRKKGMVCGIVDEQR